MNCWKFVIDKREYAIVLKSFLPRKHIMALLNLSSGKVRVLSPSNFVVGSIISYVQSTTMRSYPLIQQVEMHYVPLNLTYDDLCFLHHLLEITYHFVGYNDTAPHVYDLLVRLIIDLDGWTDKGVRYLIVFKLLALLGYYPKDSLFHTPDYYQFVREPLARLASCSIPNNDIKKIVQWLRYCISSHPDVSTFNTLSFYIPRESHD